MSVTPLDVAVDVAPPRKTSLSWPKPLADAAYYGLAGEIVHIIEPHTEADPVAILATLLGMFGMAAGDSSYARVERDKHPSRLYFALVGATSKARKGTSAGWPKYLLTHADEAFQERIIDGLSSGEGLIWQVRDPITKVKDGETRVVDDGVSDKRLMVLEGELARILKVMMREGNTLSTVLRCAWDTGDLNSATKNNPARATGSHMALVGHITQTELLHHLTDTEAANGFANRFIWLVVKRSKVLPFGGDLDDEVLEPYIEKLRKALAFARQGVRLCWDNDARQIWAEVYEELSEGKPGLIGAITARAEAQVLRLAVTYALLDMSAVIRREHLLAALALWDYAEASVRYLFQGHLGNRTAEIILEALSESSEGLTRTEIRDLFQRNASAREIDTALAILKIHGLTHALRQAPAGTRGRPAERWQLATNDINDRNDKNV